VKAGLCAALLGVLIAGCASLGVERELPAYRLIADESESAQPVAREMLRYLAAGDIQQAAELSNAPQRRAAVLRDYRQSVGGAEFRRVFADYAARRVVAELAIGERRLLVWDLGRNIAGQYYVRAGERFVIDDVPSEERSELGRLLVAYRAGRLKPSAGTE
jgi:hypothetical protein